ncbi:hypothetical protein BDZ89DRAFT_1075429, partial [Hymenopellis radicata]
MFLQPCWTSLADDPLSGTSSHVDPDRWVVILSDFQVKTTETKAVNKDIRFLDRKLGLVIGSNNVVPPTSQSDGDGIWKFPCTINWPLNEASASTRFTVYEALENVGLTLGSISLNKADFLSQPRHRDSVYSITLAVTPD